MVDAAGGPDTVRGDVQEFQHGTGGGAGRVGQFDQRLYCEKHQRGTRGTDGRRDEREYEDELPPQALPPTVYRSEGFQDILKDSGGVIPGGGGYPPPQPQAQAAPPPSRGPQVFLNEKPMRVTIFLEVVKLKAGK